MFRFTLPARRPVAALLAGVLAGPVLGAAISPPAATAATTSTVTVVDLGNMGRLNGVSATVGGINDSGLVAAGRWIEGVESHASALLLQAGKPEINLHPLIPDIGGSATVDVNDKGDAVGLWSAGSSGDGSFVYRDGRMTKLDLYGAASVSDTGFVAGGDWVRDPDGKVTRLGSLGGGQTYASGVTDTGVAVGVSDLDPDPSALRPRAFRTKPGKPIVPEDVLQSPLGGRSQAFDVNAAGQVAGWGSHADDAGGHQPVIWQANGMPQLFRTPLGGEVKAINEAGTGVGMIDVEGLSVSHAAVFQEGTVKDLNSLLPEGSGWELVRATGINDAGQITGIGRRGDAPFEAHAFVMDLGEGPTIDSVRVEHQEYPTGTWVDATKGGTTDGNTVRVTVRLTNRSKLAVVTAIELVDGETGEVIENGKRLEVLDAEQSLARQFRWDTVGLAWTKAGKPHPDPRRLIVRLRTSDRIRDAKEVSLLVKPRPVILVHGYKSNAPSSWGAYQPILSSGHPLLKGWAVGDGQSEGKMNTGSLDTPFERTNTVSENAQQEATYIEGVRDRTDAWHVDIVAHSMGGLISRWYVQELMPESRDSRPVVNRLIQMGTPNMGSPCADLILDTAAIAGQDAPLMPATQQLSTAYAATSLNPNITDRRGVTFSNMVGVGHMVPCYYSGVGDIVVTRPSARYIYDDVPESDTMHTEMTETQSDFEAYVLPRLATDPRRNDTPDRTNLVPGEGPAPIVAPQGIGAASPTVAPGATVDVPLDVPAGEKAGVVTMAPPTVGLSLLDPSGTERGSSPSGDDQPFRGLVVDNPAAGRWTLRLTNTASTEARVPVSAWTSGNPLTVEVTAEQTAPDGTVRVSARVDDDGKAVPGADVSAVVLGERGERAELTLHDDGAHDDGAAGDGTYATGTVLSAGAHSVLAVAKTDRGTRIGRTAIEVKPVDTGSHTLTAKAGPGGQVTVDPQQAEYPAGTAVTLRATPTKGFVIQGWTVDGKPAGMTRELRLTMDRDHVVVVRFMTYAVTDLGSLSSDQADGVDAAALNDKGQVVGRSEVVRRDGTKATRAYLWQDGTMRSLGTLPCTTSSGDDGKCRSYAADINNDGVVVGTSDEVNAGSDHVDGWHPFRWEDGRMIRMDWMRDAVGGGYAEAYGINDAGASVGYSMEMDADHDYRWWAMRWNGAGERVDAVRNMQFHGTSNKAGINAAGAAAGYTYTDTGLWRAAVWADGVVDEVTVPNICGRADGSRAYDIADNGTVVGEFCSLETFDHTNAFVSRDGKATDLGVGIAYAVNESGLVVGTGQTLSWDSTGRAVLWQDGVKYNLDTLVANACPRDTNIWSRECVWLTEAIDVNEKGQILVNGYVIERQDRDPTNLIRIPRALLLTPVTATADLVAAQQVSAATTVPGAPLTWTTTVRNAGPNTATDVHVDVTLPDGVEITSCATSADATCAGSGKFRGVVLDQLAAGESATVTVRAGAAAGASGTLTASADVWSRTVPDHGDGANQASASTRVVELLDKTALKFWDQRMGSTSYPATVTLTNRLGEPLAVTGVSATGDFAATTSCPAAVAPDASCPVQVTFTPTALGVRTGTVKISTGVGVLTVAVDGNGIPANSRPVVTTPEPVTVPEGSPVVLTVPFTDADVTDTHTAQVVWPRQPLPGPVPATVVESGGSGTVTATWNYPDDISDTAPVIVSDSKGEIGFAPARFTVANVAPVVAAGEDVTLPLGVKLSREGSFTDPGTADTWTATVDHGDGTGVQPLTIGAGRTFTLAHDYAKTGTYPVTVSVRDDDGGVGTATFTVTVASPNTAPSIELSTTRALVAEGAPLAVQGRVTDPDGDAVTLVADYGDGTTGPVRVDQDGRFVLDHVYGDDGERTVALRADDGQAGSGALVQVTVMNAVPEVRIDAPASGLVVPVGTAVRFAGSFTDAGRADTHTAQWTVDGVTVAGTVTEQDGSGTVAATRTFTAPGVYPVRLSVADDDGGSAGVSTVAGADAYVVVYDPSAGFVTGGVRLTLDGAAGSLGFVARYKEGATTPTGETQLSVRAAGLNLHSTSYDWLVVGSGRARYQGTATLDGRSGYAFLLSVADGGVLGGPDRVRVKVWEVATGTVVHDTQPGDPVTADPTTAVDGGNLVVHP